MGSLWGEKFFPLPLKGFSVGIGNEVNMIFNLFGINLNLTKLITTKFIPKIL